MASVIAERVDAIRPMLAGLGPDVQSGILADLVSIYLAGTPPAIREECLELLLALVLQLLPSNEKILFGDAGHPFKEPL